MYVHSMLNHRICVNGGKLLKTATMETMHKLSLLPIDAEVGNGPAHGHMPVAKESEDQGGGSSSSVNFYQDHNINPENIALIGNNNDEEKIEYCFVK